MGKRCANSILLHVLVLNLTGLRKIHNSKANLVNLHEVQKPNLPATWIEVVLKSHYLKIKRGSLFVLVSQRLHQRLPYSEH